LKFEFNLKLFNLKLSKLSVIARRFANRRSNLYVWDCFGHCDGLAM